uniref:Uncharacterized protein n=1 Tax=Anopheles dirus TaxID=7168 RepID=A0A182NLG1_9DIPT
MRSRGLTLFALTLLIALSMESEVQPDAAAATDAQTAQPSAIDTATFQRCCPPVMQPFIPTAKPKIKYIVVPPLSVP